MANLIWKEEVQKIVEESLKMGGMEISHENEKFGTSMPNELEPRFVINLLKLISYDYARFHTYMPTGSKG